MNFIFIYNFSLNFNVATLVFGGDDNVSISYCYECDLVCPDSNVNRILHHRRGIWISCHSAWIIRVLFKKAIIQSADSKLVHAPPINQPPHLPALLPMQDMIKFANRKSTLQFTI